MNIPSLRSSQQKRFSLKKPLTDDKTPTAGTAGCLLAYRLAQTPKAPSVLLLEAGPDNSASTLRIPQERYSAVAANGINYNYESAPQEALDGRVIPYARGKGLGGTSNINFMAYIESPAVDYDRWAELVGDEAFRWERTKERFKRVSRYCWLL